MNCRPSSNARRTSDRAGQRGFALLFVVAGVTAILALAAMSIDIGVGYMSRARLNRAADAAALAAAKISARGTDAMERIAASVAASNAPEGAFNVSVTAGGDDVVTVHIEGTEVIPTWFGRILGVDEMNVRSAAEATRFPLDLTLVLDVSSSMVRSGSFGAMQTAAKNFVDEFDENRDQLGVVAFATGAWEAYPIQKNFKSGASTAAAAIDSLSAFPDTNMEQGIELGHLQVLSAPPRAAAGPRRVIMVLFTDGRPTAFTERLSNVVNNPLALCIGPSATVPEYYGTLSAYLASTPLLRALSEPDANANGRRILCINGGSPLFSLDLAGIPQSPMPATLPNGMTVNSDNTRDYARELALVNANATRADRVTIYTIGLGNPAAVNPLDVPDQPLLVDIANQGGGVNANQPQGQMFFAPDSTTLNTMFSRVVARILTRMSY